MELLLERQTAVCVDPEAASWVAERSESVVMYLTGELRLAKASAPLAALRARDAGHLKGVEPSFRERRMQTPKVIHAADES